MSSAELPVDDSSAEPVLELSAPPEELEEESLPVLDEELELVASVVGGSTVVDPDVEPAFVSVPESVSVSSAASVVQAGSAKKSNEASKGR